jgi:hypothetical protein
MDSKAQQVDKSTGSETSAGADANERLSRAISALEARLRAVERPSQDRRDQTLYVSQSAGRIAAMGEALDGATRTIHALRSALADRERLLESLLTSRSWRLTAPLRTARRLLMRNPPSR